MGVLGLRECHDVVLALVHGEGGIFPFVKFYLIGSFHNAVCVLEEYVEIIRVGLEFDWVTQSNVGLLAWL